MTITTTNKGYELPKAIQAIMPRIEATALIMVNPSLETDNDLRNKAIKKFEKIANFAEKNDISYLEAATRYVIKQCKNLKRQGMAKNYNQAIAIIEDQQLNGRNVSSGVTRSLSQDKLQADINRINSINSQCETWHTILNGNDQGRGAQYRVSLDSGTSWIDHYPLTRVSDKKSVKTGREYGKVLGSLIAEYDNRQLQDPLSALMDDEYNKVIADYEHNLTVFYADYYNRLSPTIQERLKELVHSNIDKATLSGVISGSLAKGVNSKIKKLGSFVSNLHRKFAHKNAVSSVDFGLQLIKYIGKILPFAVSKYNNKPVPISGGVIEQLTIASRINRESKGLPHFYSPRVG